MAVTGLSIISNINPPYPSRITTLSLISFLILFTFLLVFTFSTSHQITPILFPPYISLSTHNPNNNNNNSHNNTNTNTNYNNDNSTNYKDDPQLHSTEFVSEDQTNISHNNNTNYNDDPQLHSATIFSEEEQAKQEQEKQSGEQAKQEQPKQEQANISRNRKKQKQCDLYSGEWVRDEEYPIYKPGTCPYVDEGFDCQTNGRQDFDYLNWRWKPNDHACHLPRFNATDFLVRLRGKRLMLVGDSMNRNQFESLLCVLREGLTNKSKMYEVHGYTITKGRGYYLFKIEDYNCTVEFRRSHFLVREGIRISPQGNSNPTLSIDRIDKSAAQWKQADILVFNTGHWWTHGKTARGKNYYKEGDHIYAKFDAVEAFKRALKTWANWIDKNLNPGKQSVFYRGYSSAHFRGGDWDSGGTCKGETRPILTGPFLDHYPDKMKIVDEVIQEMKFPVVILNVTRMTNFRKDGHPSVYGKKNATPGTRRGTKRQDCSHWCLPGVPDAWNELIYATLVYQQTSSIQL